MPPTTALSPDVLLQHEPFVRALARALVPDEARAQDVVQETWLTALRRPPRETRESRSLRAWLARVARNVACDEHRDASRRRRRERAAARPEALEPVDVTHHRLLAQREVVDAVLALQEPYRSVVLLRYYQDLAPAEIGERLGRSAATVRSQLSRAHELLRTALDGKFEGGRAMWAGLLAPLLADPAALAPIGKLWSGTTALVALAALGIVALATVLVPRIGRLGAPSAAEPGALLPADGTRSTARAPWPGRREEHASALLARRPEVASLSTAELLELAVHLQREIERLTRDGDTTAPESPVAAELALLLHEAREQARGALLDAPAEARLRCLALLGAGATHDPACGVARILHGGRWDALVAARGQGAYWSFATRKNAYDATSDLGLENGLYLCALDGIERGGLLDLGALPPEETRAVLAGEPPPRATDAVREAWDFLHDARAARAPGEGPLSAEQAARARALGVERSAPARVGHAYLLRSVRATHDQLVAFAVVDGDAYGHTLAWRVLPTRPAAPHARGNPDQAAPAAPGGPTSS